MGKLPLFHKQSVDSRHKKPIEQALVTNGKEENLFALFRSWMRLSRTQRSTIPFKLAASGDSVDHKVPPLELWRHPS